MFKFDDNGELIQESVTESAMFDSEEIELDDEDNILLFEALLLDVMTEEEYKAYTESSEYIEDLKNLYKAKGLYTLNLETLLYIELSNYNNKKFNILDSILKLLIKNSNLITEYIQIINIFFEYYYSKYNIQDISDNYKLIYNNKTKKISVELYNAYCLVYEITNNINKRVIKHNDTIILDAGKIYVINFIKKDCSERSNFLLIDTINNNIYNNIKIEMEES